VDDDEPDPDELGEIIEEKPGTWAESIEDWVERLGDRIEESVEGEGVMGERYRRRPLTEEEKSAAGWRNGLRSRPTSAFTW